MKCTVCRVNPYWYVTLLFKKDEVRPELLCDECLKRVLETLERNDLVRIDVRDSLEGYAIFLNQPMSCSVCGRETELVLVKVSNPWRVMKWYCLEHLLEKLRRDCRVHRLVLLYPSEVVSGDL